MRNRFVAGLGLTVVLVSLSQFVSAQSPTIAEVPVPGAISLAFDKPVRIDAQSNPITIGESKLSIIGVGRAQFQLDKKSQLTAIFQASVIQYAKVDYWIYAAIFDETGALLATDSHQEPVGYVRISTIPTALREIEFDFGISEKFKAAKYVVVSIGQRNVPKP